MNTRYEKTGEEPVMLQSERVKSEGLERPRPRA